MPPPKSHTTLPQTEVHAAFFFWHSFPRVKLWTNISIQMVYGIYRKMCGKSKSGTLEMGFSTITMLLLILWLCRNFWPKMAWLLFCILLTPEIWFPVTLFFKNSSWHWREEDLMTSSQLKKQLQATLAKVKMQDFCKCCQQWHKY